MEISFREALKEECLPIAKLVDIASSGVLDFLYHDLVSGKTPIKLLTEFLANENGYYSYENTVVAFNDSDITAMAVSYHSKFHGINEEMRLFFPKERLAHLEELFNSRIENSLYIDALAVREKYRKIGIGKKLLHEMEEKAKGMNLFALSLIAFEENNDAMNLYMNYGFKRAKEINIGSHELIKYSGNAFLLVCEI